MLPTKRNLQITKRGLILANQAHDLLDKKHKVLLREFNLIENNIIQVKNQLNASIKRAKSLIIKARLHHKNGELENILAKVTTETDLQVVLIGIMGVLIPKIQKSSETKIPFEIFESTSALDEAFLEWQRAKALLYRLAEIENSMKRLEIGMKKAQKRAAGLKNIIIPVYETRIKYIAEQLEERERDDLARIKLLYYSHLN